MCFCIDDIYRLVVTIACKEDEVQQIFAKKKTHPIKDASFDSTRLIRQQIHLQPAVLQDLQQWSY